MKISYPVFLYKRIISFILILGLAMSIYTPVMAKSKSSSSPDYTAGDNVYFGNLDGNQLNWTILSYDSATGIAFVVSKTPLKSGSIDSYRKSVCQSLPNEQNRGFVNWSSNLWRSWLNSTFLSAAFNSAQRKQIQKTSISKQSQQDSLMNLFHDTSLDASYAREQAKYDMDLQIYDNQVATSDYVFFLSSDEYTQYKDTIISGGGSDVWALRTNSYYAKNRTSCVDEGYSGMIEPYYHYNNYSIRPAMYVKLKEVVEADSSSSDKKKTDTSSNSMSTTNTSNTSTTASTAKSTNSANTAGASTTTVISGRNYANNAKDITAGEKAKIILPDEATYTLNNGCHTQVTIDLSYLNNTNKKYTVTYTSSDNSVFTVDSAGDIQANSPGKATLSVRMKKSNGRIYNMSCIITVQ